MRADDLQHAHVRRVLLVCAAVNVAYIPLDLAWPAGRVAIAWRLVWILVLLACAAVQGGARPRLSRIALHLTALLSGALSVVVIHFTGGSRGPRFGFLLAVGPLILLMLPDLPGAAALAGLATLLCGLLLLVREGQGVWFTFEWLALATAFATVAATGASGFRRVWLGQLEAERERALALERLADSERRRVEAERLAAVGLLAGEVAHEINSPLGAIKANLSWLRSAVAAGEPAEVLQESLDGLARIARTVSDMRALTASEPEAETTCELETAVAEVRLLAADRVAGDRLSVELAPDLPAVAASRGRLGRALAHLVAHVGGGGGAGRVSLAARGLEGGVELSVEAGDTAAWPATAAESLGLSLARVLLAQDHAVLREEQRPSGAPRFRVWLAAASTGPGEPTGAGGPPDGPPGAPGPA